MKILVAEDDRETAMYVARGLREQGHVVDVVDDGRDGFMMATGDEDQAYDVLVVDRMLPGMDGLSLVRALRTAGTQTPVIFLTAMGGLDDRVIGLNAGGDDYLVKPFAFSELAARVSALGRRPPTRSAATSLQVGDLTIDLLARQVSRAGRAIDLQPQEFKLLEYLARNAGQCVTRTMLLESVWGFRFDPKTSVVETHISRLRAKIDRDQPTELIHTIRGAGYCLRVPA